MRFIAMFVLASPLLSMPVAAQEFKSSPSPVSDAVRQALVQQAKYLLGSAELMPADKYGYHPTDAQMTFGKLVVHIVQANVTQLGDHYSTAASYLRLNGILPPSAQPKK